MYSHYTHYQVLKAISSTAEASAATPQPAVSPILASIPGLVIEASQETPDTQSPSRSDKQTEEAALLKSSSGQTQVETESESADVTLKQLMIEVKQCLRMFAGCTICLNLPQAETEPRASVNIKQVEVHHKRFMREAMQSDRQAAGAA